MKEIFAAVVLGFASDSLWMVSINTAPVTVINFCIYVFLKFRIIFVSQIRRNSRFSDEVLLLTIMLCWGGRKKISGFS